MHQITKWNDLADLPIEDTPSARVTRLLSSRENARLRGVYHAVATGPLEHLRKEYVEIQTMIHSIQAAGSGDPKLDSLVAALSAIPTEVKSSDYAPNLVTDVGAQFALNRLLDGGTATANTWYLGIVGKVGSTAPVFANSDTMASHSGWIEDIVYNEAARPTSAWSAAAARSKATSAGAVFTSTAGAGVTDTVTGCFLVNDSTKGGATGVLFSAGAFTGGDQPLVVGNVLTVTYTLSC